MKLKCPKCKLKAEYEIGVPSLCKGCGKSLSDLIPKMCGSK